MCKLEQLVFIGVILVGLADQLSKIIAARRLTGGESFRVSPLLQFHIVRNTRGPFGVSIGWITLLISWTIASVAIVRLGRTSLLAGNLLRMSGLGLAWVGATSNLLDRLWHGAVLDFIDVHIWPVFNIADVAITFGAVLALVPFK